MRVMELVRMARPEWRESTDQLFRDATAGLRALGVELFPDKKT